MTVREETAQRARDVLWFELRPSPTGEHSDDRMKRRAYGNPGAYVIGLAALPLAFVLAGLHPFGGPRLIYGALIFVSGLPGAKMVMSWAEDAEFPVYSVKGVLAQLWLYGGGALPQAVRAIKEKRKNASVSSQ